MNKVVRGALTALLAVPVFFTAGCSILPIVPAENGSQSPASAETTAKEELQTVTSEGSTFSLSFPSSWTSAELNELATIAMAYARQEQYLMVIPESKVDFVGETVDLAYYTDLVRQVTEPGFENPTLTEVSNITIGDGIAAQQFEISGAVSGINVTYLMTTIEDGSSFYQIAAWSLQSKYDAALKVFKEILATATL